MRKGMKFMAIIAVVALCCLVLAACIPSKSEDAVKKLEKADYAVAPTNSISIGLKAAGVEDIDTIVVANKGKESVVLIYFKTKDAAKKSEKEVEDFAEKMNKEFDVERSGKVIYFGTEEGVKAAKK